MGLMCVGEYQKDYIQVIAESTDQSGNPVWTFTKNVMRKGMIISSESKDYLYSDVSSKKTIYDLYQLQHVNPYFNLYAKVPLTCMFKTSKNGVLSIKSFEAGELIVRRLDSEYFYCVAKEK